MRSKMLSGMLYSSFRRPRTSLRPDSYGSAASRFRFSTGAGKAPITQRMQFARRYENMDDLVCPVKYFKEEFALLNSLDGNELLRAVGKVGRSEVSMKAARAVRSLLAIILGNHAIGRACGKSLHLSNLRISRTLGEFAMIDEPPEETEGSLIADFGLVADVLEELARAVLGPDVAMPRVWHDFIAKLREKVPRVQIIMYHSIFLPMNIRYWLRVFVDQRFRKDFDSLSVEQKNEIRSFMKDLGRVREQDDLQKLVKSNQFIKFVALRSRSGSKGRQGKPNSDLRTDEAVFGDKARSTIALNRDGVVHGSKGDLNKEERAVLAQIKTRCRTQENIVQVLGEEFELLEQTYLDLCHGEAPEEGGFRVLWMMLRMWEFFGETEDTWRAAADAIMKEAAAGGKERKKGP